MRDPAFLYYDADAARDVSHMNRLERGCYFDIIQAQRKFGAMSENLIKKVLGTDFDECWEAIKICMTYDEDMYFISWVKDSSEKRSKYSQSRANNRNSLKKGEKQIISKSYDEDMKHICTSYDSHMENENENENEIENEIEKEKRGVGEKTDIGFLDSEIFKNMADYFGLTEIRTPVELFNLNSFLNIRKNKGDLQLFIAQFDAYVLYKEKTKQTKHSFRSFVGDLEQDNGNWRVRDWVKELGTNGETSDNQDFFTNNPFAK